MRDIGSSFIFWIRYADNAHSFIEHSKGGMNMCKYCKVKTEGLEKGYGDIQILAVESLGRGLKIELELIIGTGGGLLSLMKKAQLDDGEWYLLNWPDEPNVKIKYCPFCGRKL